MVQFSVLRNSSRYAVPLGAGASYFLHAAGSRVVLDAAHGSAEALLVRIGGADLDAVVVSHFHDETLADLLPLVREFRPRLLVAPEGAVDRIRRAGGLGTTATIGVRAGSVAAIGRLALRFGPADHGCPGVSVRFVLPDRSLAYVGDTGIVAGIDEIVRGASLVVAHTLLLDSDASSAATTNLTAGSAGRLAAAAGAGRLAIAHVPFYEKSAASVAEASLAFGREVLVLRENVTVDV